jgi:hypothetical protein
MSLPDVAMNDTSYAICAGFHFCCLRAARVRIQSTDARIDATISQASGSNSSLYTFTHAVVIYTDQRQLEFPFDDN